ncbi:hypothetical protein DPMN_183862, partial [Dreissena polymorpha]
MSVDRFKALVTGERKLSQSLTNIPKVLVTDAGHRRHVLDHEEEGRSHSQPCSPIVKRRAFTTCIAGTRYLI